MTSPDGSGVAITIERIKEIARTTMERLQGDARTGTSDFRNTHLGKAAFGEVPKALDYAEQQQAAHTVFLETIHGIIADLEEFQQNLLASAEAHERNDEAVAAALTALSGRYEHHQFAAQKGYDDARHDDALIVPSEPVEQAPDTAAPVASTDVPAPDTTEGTRSSE